MLLMCSIDVCEGSVHNHCGEIFLEEGFGTLELLLRVLFHVVEFVFPSHGFPLVYAESVVGEYLDALYLLVLTESFAEGTDIFFHIAIAGHEDVAKPEGVIVLFEPSCGAQGLLVAAAGKVAMALGIELLDIEQHEVDLVHQLLHMLVPYTTIGVDTGVYAMTFQVLHQGYKCFGLYGRLTSREGDTTTLAKEGYLADGHVYDLFGACRFATIKVYSVGVCTIEATEGTALKENDEPETRPVECPHTFVGVYVYHS